jgi:hypothetical protein
VIPSFTTISRRFVLFDPNTKLWHEVSEEYAREKVSHSLRSRSSTDQRIANAASNSIKMLNNAVHKNNHQQQNETNGETPVVSIAPRTTTPEGMMQDQQRSKTSSPTSSSSSSSSSSLTDGTAPSKSPERDTTASPPSSSTTAVPSGSIPPVSAKLPAAPANGKKASHRKKAVLPKAAAAAAAPPQKAARPSAKHSLRPGIDQIVRRLIHDQQALLRGMIQKETERFTSAATMGPPPRPMPLTYKADVKAVSTLTASLPKMGQAPGVGAAVVLSPLPSEAAAATTTRLLQCHPT